MEYELLFFTSVANEEKINLIKKDVTEILESLGAKLSTDFFDIGKRKLAYPIKRNTHAFFSFVRFLIDDENKQNISEIRKRLALYNNLLRHIIVKAEEIGKPTISEEIKLEQKEKADKPITEKKPSKEKLKTSLSELDEKLNEILEENPE